MEKSPPISWKSGLSSTVLPYQSMDLTFLQLKVDMIQCLYPGKSLCYASGFQDIFCVCHLLTHSLFILIQTEHRKSFRAEPARGIRTSQSQVMHIFKPSHSIASAKAF